MRNGGLVVIETAALFDLSMAMYFNAEGRYYKGTNYFQISVNLLDYLLRLLRLAPLDMAFMGVKGGVGRIAVVCRATDDVIPCNGDDWMVRTQTGPAGHFDLDFSECLDWDFVKKYGGADVPYIVQTKDLRVHPDTNTVNLYEQIARGTPISNQIAVEQARLRLGDIY